MKEIFYKPYSDQLSISKEKGLKLQHRYDFLDQRLNVVETQAVENLPRACQCNDVSRRNTCESHHKLDETYLYIKTTVVLAITIHQEM